jgi:prolipoprotein diacylglyceryltransferase
MEKHILMDISYGGVLYDIFYMLSFLVAYSILIYEGNKRKLPLLGWVLLLASVQFASIIGTKIFSYSSEEWRFMFQNHIFLPNKEKSLLGCALFAAGTFLVAKSLLRYHYAVWDTFAIAFPISVAFMTTGCFFYGCCFGTESHLPWAVQYPVMSLAHYHQFETGILTYNDLYSLPLHPVQLYATLGGILVTILVIKLSKFWKAEGSLFLSSVILFLLMRFLVEFSRDPFTNKFGGGMLWILKEVQWLYLAVAGLMIILLIFREKTYKAKPIIRYGFPLGLKMQTFYLLSLIVIFVLLHNWLRIPEIIAVNIALLPALFFVGKEIYRTFESHKYKWVYVCSLILPLFLMSQTLPQTQIDSAKVKKINSYHTIGFGVATGSYTDRGPYTSTHPSGCVTPTITEHYFSQKYTTGGVGYSETRETPDTKTVTRYGVNVYFGDYKEFSYTANQQERQFIFGINPFIKYDLNWIGIGTGLHIGDLVYTLGDKYKESNVAPENNYLQLPLFPQFYFRIGPKKYFYADFHFADQFPVSSPGMAFQTGIGTGFGLDNGTSIRLGFSFLDEGGYYFSAYLPIINKIVLEPMYFWTGNAEKSSYPGSLPEDQFSLGISYRFGHK